MSTAPLELSLPATPAVAAATPQATAADASAGQDFAALVAQALGLTGTGSRTATQANSQTDTDTDGTPTSGATTGTKAGTKTGTRTGTTTGTTTGEAAGDEPTTAATSATVALTDQSSRDAIVAALGLGQVPTTTTSSAPAAAATPASDTTAVQGISGTAPTTGTAATAATQAGDRARQAARTDEPGQPAPAGAPNATPAAAATTGTASAPSTASAVSTQQATAQPASTGTAPAATIPGATPVATPATAGPAAGTQHGTADGEHRGGGAEDTAGPVKEAAASTGPEKTADQASGVVPAQDAAQQTATPADTVPVVTSGPVTAAPGTQPAHGRPHGVHPVTAQVIPEITRLVSDGEGVHRVTLQLNPRALGDVRVVLTMRHGDVHVRLVAGDDARVALAQSSSELSRALEQLGVKDHRISLSDTADPTTTTWSSGSDHTQDQRDQAHHSGGFDADQRDQHARHSWMGDSSTATDGMNPSNSSARTLRSVPVPTLGAPLAGALDVRM